MPDLAIIGSVLSSVKTAADLAKLIKDSDLSLTEAETKLQIAELIVALADIKIELADVQQVLIEKEQEINRLSCLLDKKKTLKYDGVLYRSEGDDVPFCPVCFETNDGHYHLTFYKDDEYGYDHHCCRVCNNKYYEKRNI
ncbi:hypothetical protein [Vibrio splendidus]|uniref:hypothetical protein n=1 Tax=Vibrio splendidus TaxID=29497 RepID=UPI000D3DA283|nr:hypothetical protein [Vibrio splendidus]PTP82118.1 hypothetical protein CWO02_23500 [Vibrio splendidus]PTQ14263.1 hypothetical protein CWO33_13670 [Vibrio splendidus]